MTVEGGHLDWTAVKEVFQAELVKIAEEGVPSCFRHGEKTGLTRRTFPFAELKVSVVKTGICCLQSDQDPGCILCCSKFEAACAQLLVGLKHAACRMLDILYHLMVSAVHQLGLHQVCILKMHARQSGGNNQLVSGFCVRAD